VKKTKKAMMTHTISEIEITYKPNHYSKESLLGVKNAADILRMFWNPDTIEYYEEFKVIYMDKAYHILGIQTIGKGGLAGVYVDVRMIFQSALKVNAHSIIVSHNHPSGNREPSDLDISLTQQIKAGGKLLSIILVDHIIMTKDSYLSFVDNGYL
jgi:DNA repair protein RadC